MKAIILTIGNEILCGQVIDTNAAWLAQQLLAEGIAIREKWSVADDLDEIIEALDHSSKKADLIITTGGLGPTADDLTTEALSKYLKVDRFFHEDTYNQLTKIFASFGRVPMDSHRLQCMLPEGVTVLPNRAGTAPGMYCLNHGVHIISMPGVPFEMKAIFDPHVLNLLRSIKSGPKRSSHTFNTAGEGETVLEDNYNGGKILKRSIDISKIPAGVYFVTVSTLNGSLTKKIVKEEAILLLKQKASINLIDAFFVLSTPVYS